MDCPRCTQCKTGLNVTFCTGGRMLRCPECDGVAITVEMLRRFAPKDRVHHIWRQVVEQHVAGDLRCPGCEGPLRRAGFDSHGHSVGLDACPHCHIVWFDANELAEFSPLRSEPPSKQEALAASARIGARPAPGAPYNPGEIWRVVATLEGLFT